MCGIVGFNSSGQYPLSEEHLLAARNSISHRGPDDSGIFFDSKDAIGLAHTRLSIIDTSRQGHQPMTNEDGSVVLIFNGEIYNFKELRSELEKIGHEFHSSSDTEVLLNFYLQHRDEKDSFSNMLTKLNGIFSFAIWDKEIGEMFLARDAFGVKPLYYSLEKNILSFSSEIKALRKIMNSAMDLDHQSLDRYISFLWCPGNGTPSSNIRKLGPGESMWVKDGAILKKDKWYELPIFYVSKNHMKVDDAIEQASDQLRHAVHRQMVSDVPLGAFLSGGLDSSAIVAFARELNPKIRCFTIEAAGGQEKGEIDDLPYAKKVAEHLDVPLDIIKINPERMAGDLQNMVEQLDEPLADPAPLNVLYISQMAREQGIKVLLSGAGGDDLFTGYRRHRALMLESIWSWLPRASRKGISNIVSNLDQRDTFSRRLGKLFSGAEMDDDERLINYFFWTGRKDLGKLYSTDFHHALSKSVTEEPMLSFLSNLPKNTSKLERMLALEQRFFLTDHNLTYTDKMSMAVGVEVRVPFLDLELVDFAARLPEKYKQNGKEGKWILKKAMEPYLPREVIYRPKTGFGAPLRRWIRHDLKELLADLLSPTNISQRGLFDPQAVQKLIIDNNSGRIDASYTIFSLLCIEIWCRKYLD